ncbi:hypothetical protein ABKV19_011614 [Rosa sericea]
MAMASLERLRYFAIAFRNFGNAIWDVYDNPRIRTCFNLHQMRHLHLLMRVIENPDGDERIEEYNRLAGQVQATANNLDYQGVKLSMHDVIMVENFEMFLEFRKGPWDWNGEVRMVPGVTAENRILIKERAAVHFIPLGADE